MARLLTFQLRTQLFNAHNYPALSHQSDDSFLLRAYKELAGLVPVYSSTKGLVETLRRCL